MLRGLKETELTNIIGQMLSDLGGSTDGEAAARAGVIEAETAPVEERFVPVQRSREPVSMLAVDGGSAELLDGGSFVVAGLRVGHVGYRGREVASQDNQEMHLVHLAAGHLKGAYDIFFGKYVGEQPADVPRGPVEAIGRFRTLMEWDRVKKLLASPDECPEGGVLALDGALWAGIEGIEPLLERISGAARERGIILCGISKRSMLVHRSRPLIPTVQMMGDRLLPDSAWLYPVREAGYRGKLFGDVYVAKLHPRSSYAFRVDLCLPDGVGPEEAVGMLAYHADDPSYVGYPYPLARVHNDVAFSRGEVGELREMLRERGLAAGIPQEEWQLMFQDFHGILDTGR